METSISIIAIITSFIALTFGVVQWIAMRRPYIAIISLDWCTIDQDAQYFWDGVKCTIRNVGQAPAKNIKLIGKTVIDEKAKDFYMELGVLLPTQEMEISIAFSEDADRDFLLSGYASVLISSSISYQGVLPCQYYKTKQEAELHDKPKRVTFLPGGLAT